MIRKSLPDQLMLQEYERKDCMKFKVTIEEHISQAFEIEAEDEKQAENIAVEKYRNGEFVVDNGSVTVVVLQVGDDGPWIDMN